MPCYDGIYFASQCLRFWYSCQNSHNEIYTAPLGNNNEVILPEKWGYILQLYYIIPSDLNIYLYIGSDPRSIFHAPFSNEVTWPLSPKVGEVDSQRLHRGEKFRLLLWYGNIPGIPLCFPFPLSWLWTLGISYCWDARHVRCWELGHVLCSEPIQRRRPSAASTKGGGLRPPPFVDSFALALNKAHVLALNTAHVLRLNKADVLALNKAHVLRLNNPDPPKALPGPPWAPPEPPRADPDLHSLPGPPELWRDVFFTFSGTSQLKHLLLRAFLESNFPEMLSQV